MKGWYLKGLSNTAHAMRMLRQAYGGEISLVGSHISAASPVARVADRFLIEPKTTEGYADWVYENARDLGVDLVMVQRGAASLWPAREAFEAAGIRLHFTADPATARFLDRKDLFGAELVKLGLPTPEFETFRTLEEFDLAAAALEASGQAPDGLCIKPVTGIFGSGFRHLRDDLPEMDMLLGNRFYEMSRAHFRDMLRAGPAPQELMLMRYLPGLERSVDFLARNGEFITGVSRVKHDASQILEAHGDAIDMARVLTGRFALNGMCNMQTREDAQGRQHVLEINPRMSGGMQLSCLSGVLLPAWDVALALDLRPASEIETPRHGLRVRCDEDPVLIEDRTAPAESEPSPEPVR